MERPKLFYALVDTHRNKVVARFETITLATVTRSNLVRMEEGNATRYLVEQDVEAYAYATT